MDLRSDTSSIPELRTSDLSSEDGHSSASIRAANGNESVSPSKKIPQTMHLSDCSGVHIGPLYNCIDPASVRTPPPGATSPINSFGRDNKKRPPMAHVEALLASNREIGDGELDTISKHLGYTWRHLGRLMKYSDGQLDNIDADSQRLLDKAFSLLSQWRDKESKRATVANLTRLLMTAEAFDVVMQLRP